MKLNLHSQVIVCLRMYPVEIVYKDRLWTEASDSDWIRQAAQKKSDIFIRAQMYL